VWCEVCGTLSSVYVCGVRCVEHSALCTCVVCGTLSSVYVSAVCGVWTSITSPSETTCTTLPALTRVSTSKPLRFSCINDCWQVAELTPTMKHSRASHTQTAGHKLTSTPTMKHSKASHTQTAGHKLISTPTMKHSRASHTQTAGHNSLAHPQ